MSRAVYFPMGTLSYTMSISLDGYIEDVTGGIAFSEPDEEVHRFANQQTRESAALLFGRGLYEVMEEFWTAPTGAAVVEQQHSVRQRVLVTRGSGESTLIGARHRDRSRRPLEGRTGRDTSGRQPWRLYRAGDARAITVVPGHLPQEVVCASPRWYRCP